MEDHTGALTVEKILKREKNDFRKSTMEVPYYQFTNSAYWVRFDLKSRAAKSGKWYLELSYPLMDHVQFHASRNGKILRSVKTGYLHPFGERPFAHRHFVFPIELDPGERITCYMRFRNEDRMEIPLSLWSETAFHVRNNNEQYIMGIYFGIVVFMLIYHLLLLVSFRDRTYMHFILFLASLSLFILTQNGYMNQYFLPDLMSPYNHYIPLTISLVLIALIHFTQSFLNLKINLPVMNRYFYFLKIILALTILTPLFLDYSICIIIQVCLSLFTLFPILYSGIACLLKKYRPAQFFMLAWSGSIVGGIIYALKVAGALPSNALTNYALQFGSVLQFILLSFGLGDRINLMRHEKEDADRLALMSERRFSQLVESTDEIIFTLDESWNILTINRAVKTHFRIEPGEVISRSIVDLIYDEAGGVSVAKQFVFEKLALFEKTREPIEFRAAFKSKVLLEPVEMQVMLQYVSIGGGREILGRAVRIKEDQLMRYFKSEKQSYEIGNFLITAEDITHRITRNLNRYMPVREVSLLRIALREIIINSIEHGNLEISYEEKSDALMRENYFEFISQRQRDDRYSGKKVFILYSIDDRKAVYRISDEGNGFDHRHIIGCCAEEANRAADSHGRGIAMTLSIFDTVRYNERGNRVLLVKYFG